MTDPHPWTLNEHGLWCPSCGTLIANERQANDDAYEAPGECHQCGFPDADKLASYHCFDDDDDCDEDEDEFDCPAFFVAGQGWHCPKQGSEECDWECPHS